MNQGLLDSSRIEQYILGGILCESICMADCVSQGVLPSHFAHPLHRKIYETAMSGYQKRNEVVMEDLLSSLQMDPDGSVSPQQSLSYMTNLMDGYVGYSQYDHYIRLLLEKAQRRRLMESAQKILSLCEQEEDQDVLLDSSERVLMEVTQQRIGAEFQTPFDVLREMRGELEDLWNGKHRHQIVTGFSALDGLTGCFKAGELVILAARPAMGKTAFALNLAFQTALRNEGAVAVFSLEMPALAVMKRIVSGLAQVDGQKLNSGRMSEAEKNAVFRAFNTIQEQNLMIDDTSMLSTGQIFSKVRKLKAEKKKISLIVIDYLQLIQGNSRRENRQQEITEISRNLKILAKEMDCPVIALSQLSRKVEERTDHEPQLSDLRESGAIEQDADMVLFLYRESYYANEENPDPVDMVDVFLKKNRNGKTGKVSLAFEKNISKFSNLAYER